MNWQETERAVKKLAEQIPSSPDIIVAIVRGGLIPARLLAKFLGVKDMYALTVKKSNNERLVTSRINEDIHGKVVLVVEDVLESGTSLAAARDYLEDAGASVVTAALFVQPHSVVKPDYFVATKDNVPLFPWD
jgi:uncharacterized protein